jgi:hypothetical protein
LQSRPHTTPRTIYAKSTEAELSADPLGTFKNGPLDFRANPVPLRAIESRARFNSDDLCAFIGERNPTFLAHEGQMEHIARMLTKAKNPLLKKQPQVCLIEIGPRVAKKIFVPRHHLS